MFLRTKDGIACDTCNLEFRDSFTYYSCQGIGYVYNVDKGLKEKNGLYLDFDMCESCRKNYYREIIANLVDAKEGHIKDDLSKEFFRSTVYMQILLTKVVVKIQEDSESDGIVDQKPDIDFIIAGDSLKKFLKKITEIRNKRKEPKEEDEWTMK